MAEREMTGIEALEELTNMIHREKHINSTHNNKINNLKEIVLKDLILFQGFKDNHHSMEKRNIELKEENLRNAISEIFCRYDRCIEIADVQGITHLVVRIKEEVKLIEISKNTYDIIKKVIDEAWK